MSRDENTPQSPQTNSSRRRSSFTANKLSEMFNSQRNPNSNGNGSPASPSNSPPTQSQPIFTGPSNAAARRLSISGALGISGVNGSAGSSAPNSATGSGPGGLWGIRRGSLSASNGSNVSEESAIDESAEAGDSVGQPPSPLGRRVSFGARAMGQMRQNDGFNWADNLRNRQSRSGSVGGTMMSNSAARNEQMQSQQAKMTQPPKNAPAAPAPAPKERPAPDHFQERILKGDFYMD